MALTRLPANPVLDWIIGNANNMITDGPGFLIGLAVDWVNTELLQFVNSLLVLIQMLTTNPPAIIGSGLVGYLYGNVLGVMPLVVLLATTVALTMALAIRKKVTNFLVVLVLGVMVLIVNSGFFVFTDWLYQQGTDASVTIQQIFPNNEAETSVSQQLFEFPLLANIIATFIGTGMAFPLVGLYWLILLSYAVLNVTVNFWLPMAIAFYGISDGFKKFSKILVSIGIVSLYLGRPAGTFFIELAQGISGLPGLDNVIITHAMLSIGLLTAVGVQPVLLWLTYKGVNYAISKVNGNISVSGKVETENKTTQNVNVQKVNEQHALAHSGRPAIAEVYQHRLTTREQIAHDLKQQAIKRGADAIQIAAVARFGPKGGAVVQGASKLASEYVSKTANQHSREKQYGKEDA